MTAPVRSVFSFSPPDTVRSTWRTVVVVLLVATLAMAPELVVGLTVTDNYRFNSLWPDQFAELFRNSHPYPRWLPRAWGGLGAPTFYFYPPFFCWIASVSDAITGGALGPERFVPIGTMAVLAGSGLAMRAWLRPQGSERTALVGAIAYMVAPYHLYDIYCRGALSETAAYASLPVVMLALTRLGAGRHCYLPMLAVAYAILLLTHLPTALLISVLVIPAYVVRTALNAERPIHFIAYALAGGVLGTGLAAVYIIPALTLLPFVNSDALSQGFYQPERWFFWKVPAGPMGGRMLFIIPVAIGAALLAASAIVARRQAEPERQTIFWAVMTICVVLLIAGLFPPFWKLPGMSLVQFPWRALLIVEFATITMLATLNWRISGPLPLAALTIVAFAYLLLGMMTVHTLERTANEQSLTASQLRHAYLDAPEYTPRGVRIDNADDPEKVHVELSPTPLASASDPRAIFKVSEANDGSMAIAIESPTATTIKLRRYYFPHWRVRDAHDRVLQVSPDPSERVVTFVAPAGKSFFQLELGTAPYEILGRAISAVALVLLGAAAILSSRGQRRFSPGSPTRRRPRRPVRE